MNTTYRPVIKIPLLVAATVAAFLAVALLASPALALEPTLEPRAEHDAEPTTPEPTGLTVDDQQGSLAVAVDWNDVAGADHYLVRWGLADHDEGLNDEVEVQSSQAEITLANYGAWIVRVQACDDGGCGSPAAKGFEVKSDANPAPSFPVATSGLSFQEGEEITETTLPEGLSFDPATRDITGAPTAAGGYSMTHTASDADGDEASFVFTTTVDATTERSAGQRQIRTFIGWAELSRRTPDNLSVSRKQLASQSSPEMVISWDALGRNGIVHQNGAYELAGYPAQLSRVNPICRIVID